MATAKAERVEPPVTLTVVLSPTEANAFRIALEASARNNIVAVGLTAEFYRTLAEALLHVC